jgi:hypothetical protein
MKEFEDMMLGGCQKEDDVATSQIFEKSPDPR